MSKSLFDPDRLIFAGKTCLVASILMGIILVVRASYLPSPTAATVHENRPVGGIVPASPSPVSSASLVPPTMAPDTIFQLNIDLTSNPQRKQGNAFCIRLSPNQHYLVSHASLLNQSEWASISKASVSNGEGTKTIPLTSKPLYLGPFTEDHLPNMLSKPDLGLDLVVWPMPTATTTSGLLLTSTSAVQGDSVWIMGAPGLQTKAQARYQARVLEMSENTLSLQPIDRVPLDSIIGLAVVNQLGEVIGNVLGGSDLTLTGASAPALRRRLISINSK